MASQDVLGIYYHHFARENHDMRKRHYSARRLVEVSHQIQSHIVMLSSSRSIDEVCRCLRRMAMILDDDKPRYRAFYHLDMCYRNHVYPYELDNRFKGADIRAIDAILILRDPSPSAHHRVRRGCGPPAA